ncbi:hypothetical protein BFP70_01425 [Thioclava sp. SK-1]|uniref:TetR/AcrR family transcriptional regulator n=1 Tax=Thioclava sp. SK-1 TaxID=1889770 RepID=UPI0008252FBB|nr:TetR/AcrR family transcriptional regulator [Thioclava sp. SK-1]OCX61269.1 hypothetical protein BFP70_01425 [Thioclava sp. SK-1]
MTGLRSRRRSETAKDIQRAALSLIQRDGYDAVTTDAISRAAGISQRTFFNYYANKESALMGELPEISEQARAALLSGEGPAHRDLYRMMYFHTLGAMDKREELLVFVCLLNEHPQIFQLYLTRREQINRQLESLLAEKFPDLPEMMIKILADVMLNTGWAAIRCWLQTDTTLEAAFDNAWASLLDCLPLLLPTTQE